MLVILKKNGGEITKRISYILDGRFVDLIKTVAVAFIIFSTDGIEFLDSVLVQVFNILIYFPDLRTVG